jgi:hypothetical protein
LKKKTIAKRRQRRIDAAEQVEKTAKKLLDAKLKLAALQTDQIKDKGDRPDSAGSLGSIRITASGQVRDEYQLPDEKRFSFFNTNPASISMVKI